MTPRGDEIESITTDRDTISAKLFRLQCAQYVDKRLKMPALIRSARRSVKLPPGIVTATAQPWYSTHLLVVIVFVTKKVVP